MRIERISDKQRQVLEFALSDEGVLICDGAVRTGKTTMMAAAFLIWAMENYDRTGFGLCAKTVRSAQRNLVRPLEELEDLPYTLEYKASAQCLTVRCGERENYFYLFGGRDESSYALIQGMTLAGVLFDEAALMPHSFIEQAVSRTISFARPKLFFSCNPQGPECYFYREWICKQRAGTRYLRFTMADNPALTPAMIARAEEMYTGVFYDRYIRGEWTAAEGLIYPMFGPDCVEPRAPEGCARYVIAMDYGIQNPTAMGLWGLRNGVWYQVAEYYHSGRETGRQLTDAEYYARLERLAGERQVECVIVDPSAASFIALVRQKGRFRVRRAVNDVLEGIRRTGDCLRAGKIRVCAGCRRTIEEYGLYRWDEDAGRDRPVKENDHAMDMTRYFVSTMGVWREKRDYRALWTM